MDNLLKKFSKEEILEVARELDLKVKLGDRSSLVLEKIMGDLEAHGVPETDDCSELLFEFLVTADFVDEDGNLLGEGEEEEDSSEETVELEVVKPECFSFADKRDPACNRCVLLLECAEVRIRNRPSCYGRLFDRSAEECKVCIEAPFCMVATTNKEK